MTPLLHVDKMTHYFGGLRAVHNYNLSVGPHQIVGLIGPNGAGKTTVFNLITGVYTPTEGRITLENESIVGLETNEIAAKGLGRTFQNLALWRHMNVLDHIKMAHYSQLSYSLFDSFFNTGKCRRQEARAQENAYRLLELFDIKQHADQLVTSLPYGAQAAGGDGPCYGHKPQGAFFG